MDELKRHAAGLWRRRWIAVALAWVICAAGWFGVSRIPDSYEASARLYVDADEVLTPLLRGLALDNSLGNQIEVLQRTLLSRPNLEKLISKTDLELTIRSPSDLERLIGKLQSEIRIQPQTRNLFTITYQNTSPQLAYDVVNTALNIFIESKIGHNRSDMDNARQFLDEQIKGYERKLREAEQKRAEFRTRYIDLLPGDGGVSRLDAAREQARLLQGQLIDATGRHDRLVQELATTPQTLTTETIGGSGGGGGGGSSELAAAQRKLAELLGTETDQHPDVVRQRRLIEQLKASGGGAAASAGGAAPRPPRALVAPSPIYNQLKVLEVQAASDVASLTRQVSDAVAERDRLEAIARSAPGVQAQFINLDRDYDVVRRAYDELLARREQMRLSAAADSDADKVKLQIIDPPQVPHLPVGPKRLMLMAGVLAAGLAGGAGAALLLAQLDHAFHDLKQLRALGLPVAGGVSLLAGAVRRSLVYADAAALAVAVLALGGVFGGLVYHTLRQSGLA